MAANDDGLATQMVAAQFGVANHVLVTEFGSEKWLKRRIQEERKARGWSQAELARRMAAAGYPIHQSAISKIEPADPEQRTGRRRERDVPEGRTVTIGEAIGFSKVLEIPLVELLLPPTARARGEALQSLVDGPKVGRALVDTQARYDRNVRAVADEALREPSFAQELRELAAEMDEPLPEAAKYMEQDLEYHMGPQRRFVADVMAAIEDALKRDRKGRGTRNG